MIGEYFGGPYDGQVFEIYRHKKPSRWLPPDYIALEHAFSPVMGETIVRYVYFQPGLVGLDPDCTFCPISQEPHWLFDMWKAGL